MKRFFLLLLITATPATASAKYGKLRKLFCCCRLHFRRVALLKEQRQASDARRQERQEERKRQRLERHRQRYLRQLHSRIARYQKTAPIVLNCCGEKCHRSCFNMLLMRGARGCINCENSSPSFFDNGNNPSIYPKQGVDHCTVCTKVFIKGKKR